MDNNLNPVSAPKIDVSRFKDRKIVKPDWYTEVTARVGDHQAYLVVMVVHTPSRQRWFTRTLETWKVDDTARSKATIATLTRLAKKWTGEFIDLNYEGKGDQFMDALAGYEESAKIHWVDVDEFTAIEEKRRADWVARKNGDGKATAEPRTNNLDDAVNLAISEALEDAD